jgi:hypothetical protein
MAYLAFRPFPASATSLRSGLRLAATWAGLAGCFSSGSGGTSPDACFDTDSTDELDGAAEASEASTAIDGSPVDAGTADAGALASASGTCMLDAGANAGTAPSSIDFDTWPDGGTIASGTFIDLQYPGVTFASTSCGGAQIYSDGEASSPPNFLIGSPGSFDPIVMDLTTAVSQVGVTLISVGASTVTATAYDATGATVIDSISVTHPGTGTGFGAHDPITLSGAGIARVVFAITTPYPGDGFGIDDVTLP